MEGQRRNGLTDFEAPWWVDAFIRRFWIVKPDPLGIEYVVSPDLQLCFFDKVGFLAGDCDDAATLAAALLVAFGVPCWFVAIRMAGDRDFSHVFCRTEARDIDPIVPLSILPHVVYAEKIDLIL